MAEFPALPLWTDALIGDTFHLTPAEFGAYMRLLVCAWRTSDCALPDNDAQLGRMIGDPKNWHRLRAIVMAFFHKGSDGLYRQKRLSDEREYVSRQAEKSAAGGRAKALKNRKHRSAKSLPNECLNSAPIPTPISNTSKEVLEPKRKSKRILPDHFPLEENFEWAKVYWLQKGRFDLCESMIEEAGKFRDFHTARGSTSADWSASWRTWAQNAIKFNNGGHNAKPNGTKRTATDQHLAGLIDLGNELRAERNR